MLESKSKEVTKVSASIPSLRFGIEDITTNQDRVVDMTKHELTFNNIKGIRTDGNILFPHDPADTYSYGIGQLNSTGVNTGQLYQSCNNYLQFDGNSTDNYLNLWSGSQDNNSNYGWLQINGYVDKADLRIGVLSVDPVSTANNSTIIFSSSASTYPTIQLIAQQGNTNSVSITTPTPKGTMSTDFIMPVTVNGIVADHAGNIQTLSRYTPMGTADSFGTIGQETYDANFRYIKTTEGWMRSVISTF